jgi:hypothetical protein
VVSLHLKEKELQIAGDVIPMSLGTGNPLVNDTPLLYRPKLRPSLLLYSDQIC